MGEAAGLSRVGAWPDRNRLIWLELGVAKLDLAGILPGLKWVTILSRSGQGRAGIGGAKSVPAVLRPAEQVGLGWKYGWIRLVQDGCGYAKRV